MRRGCWVVGAGYPTPGRHDGKYALKYVTGLGSLRRIIGRYLSELFVKVRYNYLTQIAAVNLSTRGIVGVTGRLSSLAAHITTSIIHLCIRIQ